MCEGAWIVVISGHIVEQFRKLWKCGGIEASGFGDTGFCPLDELLTRQRRPRDPDDWYLESAAPDEGLKCGKDFLVRQITGDHFSREIVRAIVLLARNLGMAVIAEGVETAEQLAALREMACDFAQGYYFAKPLPAADATALIAQRKQW